MTVLPSEATVKNEGSDGRKQTLEGSRDDAEQL